MSAPAVDGTGFVGSLRRLSTAQKSSKGAPPYSLFVNRPLGRVFAAAAFQVGLTPNQVTAISAVFTYAGIVVLALAAPSVTVGVLVALALVIGYALDSADGQLARLRGGGSLTGEWLDHMIDSLKVSALHIAVVISLFRWSDLPAGWMLVPLAFCLASAVHFFGMILNDLVVREHRAKTGTAAVRAAGSTKRSLAKLPTDYGVLCLAFLLLGAAVPFMIVYTVLAVAMVGYTALAARKWFGDVQQLDRENAAAATGAVR